MFLWVVSRCWSGRWRESLKIVKHVDLLIGVEEIKSLSFSQRTELWNGYVQIVHAIGVFLWRIITET